MNDYSIAISKVRYAKISKIKTDVLFTVIRPLLNLC